MEKGAEQLWFDVGIKRYTTKVLWHTDNDPLWFDVGIKRYTTATIVLKRYGELWFDVGIKRYTTFKSSGLIIYCCGLM